MPLNSEEMKRLELAKSIQRMASEQAWQLLMHAETSAEADAIAKVEEYLDGEAHPDREELMTLVLKWYCTRKHRLLFAQQVSEAKDFKADLRTGLLAELLANPQPVDDITRELLMEEL